MHTWNKPLLRILAAWRRYAIEAFFAATLMFCIELFVVAFEHPGYPARQLIALPWARRACVGILMGSVVALLCASPWGKRSGAHMNPAVTLATWTLDKMKGIDAILYVIVQMIGATLGVWLGAVFTDGAVAHPAVDHAVTSVGKLGVGWAFSAECAMAFCLMTAVLWTSLRPRAARFTPGLAGAMIALFVTIEAPLSGMSINPVRSLSAGMMAGHLERFWLYASAPTMGMLAAALLFRRRQPAALSS